MAIVQNSDIFVPQVIGDVASDILWTKVPLLRSQYVKNAAGDVWSEGGNTVTFPYFDTTLTGQVQDQVNNSRTGVTPTKVSVSSYTETLSNKIVSLDFDKNVLRDASSATDLNQHVGEVVARESAATIQNALITSAEGTSLELDITGESTTTLNVDSIVEAKMERGEWSGAGMPALFVHSKQYTDLAKSSDFKTLATAATTTLASAGNMPDGAVAMVHGCWVVLMDSISTNTVPDPDQYTALLVYPDALGLYMKQEIEASEKTHAGSSVLTYDFDFRFTTTLYRNNPRGVVKLITE